MHHKLRRQGVHADGRGPGHVRAARKTLQTRDAEKHGGVRAIVPRRRGDRASHVRHEKRNHVRAQSEQTTLDRQGTIQHVRRTHHRRRGPLLCQEQHRSQVHLRTHRNATRRRRRPARDRT